MKLSRSMGGVSLAKEKSCYELSKTRTLNNAELAEWLRALEDKVNQGTTSAKKSKASISKAEVEKS
jgi:hypothetical protein